jgi:hypothetical protein
MVIGGENMSQRKLRNLAANSTVLDWKEHLILGVTALGIGLGFMIAWNTQLNQAQACAFMLFMIIEGAIIASVAMRAGRRGS